MEDKHLIESDKNPFPKMDIIPGLGYVKWLGRQIMNVIYFFPIDAPSYMSDHNTGAAPLLDSELYDNPH